MKCKQMLNLFINMPLISIMLIFISIKNAASINYYDDNNGYTSTNHLRHYFHNHPDYKSHHHHHPIESHPDGYTSHKSRIHQNRQDQELDQKYPQYHHHHNHQHQHPHRVKQQNFHRHNINKDEIDTPWKVPLPIGSDVHLLIDDQSDNQHNNNGRLYQRYESRRIENAVNAYKMSRRLQAKEHRHKNSHSEQNAEMYRADSMSIARGHFNKSTHKDELQLNEDLKNLISETTTLTAKLQHMKKEKKKKTKALKQKKKTTEEEDYYYYDQENNDDDVDDNDDDSNSDSENDDVNEDINDNEHNENDDDHDDGDSFIVDPNQDDVNNENDENDDNYDDDDEFLAAVLNEQKYIKGKSTRAIGVPIHKEKHTILDYNDYVDDEPHKNDDNKFAAYENPVKKPAGTLTAEKWQNYGTPEASAKSKRRYSTQYPGQQLVSAHYERIKREGACRIPRPKIIMKPSEATKRYRPSWTILHRCSDSTGCCDLETKTCVAINRSNVDLAFFVIYVGGETTVEIHTYENHTRCACVDRYGPMRDNDDNEYNDVVAIDGNMINRTCQCPKYFNITTVDDNIIADKRNKNSATDSHRIEGDNIVVGTFKAIKCLCDCNGSNSHCQRLKRGEEDFSLEDKRCIQTRQCTEPQCQNGAYINGRCPRTHIRRRHSGHHRP